MQLQKVTVPFVKLMLQSYCQFGISTKMLLLQEALKVSKFQKQIFLFSFAPKMNEIMF